MVYLYNLLLFKPIFNLLVFLYNTIPLHDIGIAIIILTVIIKLILYPLSRKSIQSQKALQELQPKLDELKEKYKDEKEKMAQEMMKLYKEQKVNPLSSCLPLLIQLPFFIAVYHVFRSGLSSSSFENLYSFVSNPGTINTMFLGIMDLSAPVIPLAVLAGVGQYFQVKMLSKKQPPATIRQKEGAKDENMMAMMNKQMQYMMPIMTIVIGVSLPGGLTLYWFITTVLTIAQQAYVFRNENIAKEGTVEVISNQR